jgi:hypothetical protein
MNCVESSERAFHIAVEQILFLALSVSIQSASGGKSDRLFKPVHFPLAWLEEALRIDIECGHELIRVNPYIDECLCPCSSIPLVELHRCEIGAFP